MKTINVEINVDNKEAVKSVNSLEQELEQLREEFSKVEIGSKEFERLGNQIKKTEGQIKDIELQFESLDKEQRIVAVTDSFAGLAGTVEIAVGAFAALGIESEGLEDVERRVVGLIGVVQGFQALGEGLIAFNKIVGPGLKAAFTTATGAVNGFRVALASIGVGLVISGIVALTDALEEASTVLGLTSEELQGVADDAAGGIAEVEKLTRAVEDQTLSENDRREALAKLQEQYPNYFENLGDDIEDTESLQKAKDKLVDSLVREAKVRALQDKIAESYKDTIGEELKLTEQLNEFRAGANNAIDVANKKLKEGRITQSSYNTSIAQGNQLNLQADAIQQKINKLQSERTNEITKLSDLIDKNTIAITKNGGATDKSTETTKKSVKATEDSTKATEENVKVIEAQGKALGETTSAEEQYTANFVDLSNIRIEATQMEESVRKEIREKRRKERQEEFREDAEAFQGQVGAYADYANSVADNIRQFQEQNTEVQQNLLKNQFDQGLITEEQYLKQSEELQKKAFEQNKNVSIAQAIISTIQGGVDAFTSTLKIDPTGITGTILAGLALAAGYAQVDAIRSTSYESPNEGPSSIGGGGSARVGVPLSTGGGAPGGLFSDRVTLGQDSATTGAGGTTKMYVLAGDVTSAQAANAKIKQRRKL